MVQTYVFHSFRVFPWCRNHLSRIRRRFRFVFRLVAIGTPPFANGKRRPLRRNLSIPAAAGYIDYLPAPRLLPAIALR
jgi:hypothetical protein